MFSNLFLRPHHGLCIQFYEGKGYSEEFIQQMDLFIAMIKNNPNRNIRLHTDTDTLCSACPNNKDNSCFTYDKVLQYDQKVLTLCDYKQDQVVPIKEFLDCVREIIIDTKQLDTVCSDCEWYSICSKNL